MPVESLKCPNCGAPLDVVSEFMRCPYCSTNVHFQMEKGGQKAVTVSDSAAGSDPIVKELVDKIVSLCRQGKKIDAIKLYRLRTNDGLADAKNAVEGLEKGISLPGVMEKLRAGTKPY